MEARTSRPFAETTTMIVIGIILGAVGIGFFCWLLFTLAVYALPFSASLTAGLAAFHSGAGVIGAIVVGIVAGAVTLCAGQLAFAVAGSPLLRAAVALLFATPAAVTGYHATLALAHIGVSSQGWREAFAIIGAILVGGAAWRRMTLWADPLESGRPPPSGSALPLLTAASTKD